MKMPTFFALGASILLTWSGSGGPAVAHGGGLNAAGCHNNRKTGDYHCHGGKSSPSPRKKDSFDGSSFSNCTAARNAGAAPVRRGDPGYGTHLDRDNDGVGCE